jgi:hypothetical protein
MVCWVTIPPVKRGATSARFLMLFLTENIFFKQKNKIKSKDVKKLPQIKKPL